MVRGVPVSSTLPVPEECHLVLAAERSRVAREDSAIVEFLERRQRRAQASWARQMVQEATDYVHEHPDNRLAEIALHLALEAETRAQWAYLEPDLLALGYTRGA